MAKSKVEAVEAVETPVVKKRVGRPPASNPKKLKAKPTVKIVSESDIDASVDALNKVADLVEEKMAKVLELVGDIKRLADEKGIQVDELTKYTTTSNRLTAIRTKLRRYSTQLNNEATTLKQKAAIMDSLADLHKLMNDTGETE